MSKIITKSISAAVAGTLLASVGFSGPANAASSKEAEYTRSTCEGADAVCGVIVMGNAGSYTLSSVQLKAHTAQYDNAHPSCASINKKLTRDVPAGNYDVFTVPASCSYKLKVSIKSGNSKDKNIYLTPGCKIIAKVDGTVTSNSWKTLEISALADQVPTNSDGKPIDSNGYKCGKLSGAK